jgi:arylsulfatase
VCSSDLLSKYEGQYDEGYEVLKEQRWQSAKKHNLVPQEAKLAEPNTNLRPWKTLSKDEQAMEARGMEVYAGMLDAMDYHYGRVVDFLKDIGEYDNTIIVFLSDNGANPWYSSTYPGAKEPEFANQFDNSIGNIGNPKSNYAYGIGFASSSGGPLDKFKMTVGEGGIRAPLIISGPGLEEGKNVKAFTYVTDIMPTILELTGVEYTTEYMGRKVEPMIGRSLVELLQGKKDLAYSADEYVGGEMGGGKWMRQGDLKAVMVPGPYGTGEWQLFDVARDPGEAEDLSKKIPEKLDELMAAWEKYASNVGVIPPE